VKTLLLLFLLCCLGLTSCQDSPAVKISAQVQRVVSGQTLEVSLAGSTTNEQVRLIGIEAPDLAQDPWGQRAKTQLEELLSKEGKGFVFEPVLLEMEITEPDSYGRRWAYVWQDGKLVNEQMVKMGYALATRYSGGEGFHNKDYQQKLVYAQDYARIMGYGIWNPDQPMQMTPAEFRR
jgi:micrococcal nuclease